MEIWDIADHTFKWPATGGQDVEERAEAIPLSLRVAVGLTLGWGMGEPVGSVGRALQEGSISIS